MTFPSGRFVWFEYMSKESARAQAFYGELFNWKTQAMPAPSLPGGQYVMIAAGAHTLGGCITACQLGDVLGVFAREAHGFHRARTRFSNRSVAASRARSSSPTSSSE